MRAVAEWVGATDDARVPPRVRVRVFERHGGCCRCGCGRKIAPGETWQLDHVIALCHGGAHAEGNLWPVLTEHHRNKTRADVALKAKGARVRAAHWGVKAPRRPMLGSRASGWRKRMDGTVERR